MCFSSLVRWCLVGWLVVRGFVYVRCARLSVVDRVCRCFLCDQLWMYVCVGVFYFISVY